MQVSVPGFVRMVEVLKTLADMLCQGRLVFALEGGYHYEALSSSVAATLNVLLGNREFADPLGKKESQMRPIDFSNFINMVKNIHKL